jgi:hypothetical protein
MLLRQVELQRVLGRRLLERLIRTGWVEPIRPNGSGIFFDAHKVHRALSRIQRGGWLADGLRNDPETRKVQEQSVDGILVNISLDDLTDE